MKALARLEAILQELAEGPQRLLTPRGPHPVDLANAITRAFEGKVLPVGDRVIAPNEFSIRLHPGDLERLSGVADALERELALYIGRAAEERRVALPAPPRVSLTADDGMRPGGVEVEARFGEAPPPPSPRTPRPTRMSIPEPAVAGFTERIDRRAAVPAAPPDPGRAALELLAENGRVLRAIRLDGPIVTIGRRSGNDIALLDLEVSRQHARIDFVSPRHYISDLGSTNGTRVNGRTVQGRQPLRDGDVIEIGHQRLRFRQG